MCYVNPASRILKPVALMKRNECLALSREKYRYKGNELLTGRISERSTRKSWKNWIWSNWWISPLKAAGLPLGRIVFIIIVADVVGVDAEHLFQDVLEVPLAQATGFLGTCWAWIPHSPMRLGLSA